MVRATNQTDQNDQIRVAGMDGFRGVAVMCMVLVHTARVAHESAKDSLVRASLTLFEPAVSVAFLWLVGWSLQRSYSYAHRGACALGVSQTGTSWRLWYRSRAFRAAMLYGVGVVLFLLQYGAESPDGWLSPDILSTIACAILLVGALLPFGTGGLLGGAVAAFALLAIVQLAGVDVSGVNAGPGATVPLVAIACVGACQGLDSGGLNASRSKQGVWALGGVLCALVALVLPGQLVDQHASQYANGTVWFWNHTLRGSALYGGAVVAAVALARAWGQGSQVSPWDRSWAAPLSLLGRHALLTYVGHLLVLGAVDRWLPLPRGWSTFVMLSLGLLGVFVAIAMMVESTHARRVQRTLRDQLGLRRNTNS